MSPFDALPCPFLVSDPDGRVLELNRALLELVGGIAQDWRAQPMDRLFPAASRIFLQTHVWPLLLREGQVQEIKLHLLGATGERLPVLTNCQRDTGGDTHQYRWVFFVSRERSRFEDELLQARKRAESTLELLQRSERALQQSLRDKEGLIKEVHHRVKNNLQVINSLLRLESRRSQSDVVKSVLGDMQGRILTMAMLHESLYRASTFASVDLASYLRQLATQAFQAQSTHSGAVQLEFDLGLVQVGTDQAILCGLLVNELISNCMKHGFPEGRSGHVRVSLQPLGATRQWRLGVSDTGVGLPENFEDQRKGSLGLQLSVDLARQIGGVLDIASHPGAGAAFNVAFEATEPAPPA